MRVDEIGIPRRAARRPRVRREEERQEHRLPRAPPQVPDDPVPVREPVVPERGGRYDDHLDARLPQVLDRVAHEDAGDVVPRARIRRREDGDLHSRRARAATTGSAATRVANT